MTDRQYRIISLNNNGLSKKSTREKILNLFKKSTNTIICLQETKMADSRILIREWQDITMGGKAYAENHISENSGGIAILFSKEISQIEGWEVIEKGRAAKLRVKLKDQWYQIVNIYCPNEPSVRKELLTKIEKKLDQNIPSLIAGDFNFVENLKLDRWGGTNRQDIHSAGKLEMQKIKTLCNLCDPFREKNKTLKEFTWENVNVKSRLDRIYISRQLLESSRVEIKRLDKKTYCTDHKMVTTTFYPKNEKSERGPSYWKFRSNLLEDSAYTNMMSRKLKAEIRNKQSAQNPSIFYENLKIKIKIWSIDFANKKKIEDQKILSQAKKRIKKERRKKVPNENLIQQNEIIIAEFEALESERLRVRAKMEKLEAEEKSSAYFYQMFKTKAKNSNIEKLKVGNGTTDDQGEILKEAKAYYDKLFGPPDEPPDENVQTELLNSMDAKLSNSSRTFLDQPITLQDLKSALKTMPKEKAPGIDGLSYEFFKKFEDIILPIFLEAMNHSMETGKMSKTQRSGIITLIHKEGGDKEILSSYRPVSLLGVDLKIYTKAIATKLQSKIGEVIDTGQTAGIPGRNIFHNLWATRDILDMGELQNREGWIVSLDFMKAFDMVSHDFLFKCLKQLGFGVSFINLIKTIYTENVSIVQNNGFLSKEIKNHRGIRQGDPLSCYLFILCAECLSNLIRKNELIHGYALPDKTTHKVGGYADDTLIYMKNMFSNYSGFLSLQNNLEKFEKASGSKFNMDKCKALAFGGTKVKREKMRDNLIQKFKNTGQLKFEILAIDKGLKALGITFKGSIADTYSENYKKVKNKIEKKVNFAKLRNIGIQGRVQATNTLLLAPLWNVAMVLPLTNFRMRPFISNDPVKYIDEINVLIQNYIWNGRIRLGRAD